MAQIGIGQRVQVIDGGLTEYKQRGTVMAAGTSSSWYVLLDGAEQSVGQIFFHGEELQAVELCANGLEQRLHLPENVTS